jgi:hypothetical protein
MAMRIACTFFLMALLPVISVSQRIDTLSRLIAPDYQGILEEASQDGMKSNLEEMLDQMQEEPLDLTEASSLELQQLPGVSPVIANRIADFRARHGIRRIEDLLKIEGIDDEVLRTLLPFVTIRTEAATTSTYRAQVTVRSHVVRSSSTENGMNTGGGSPVKVYNRLVARISRSPVASGSFRGPDNESPRVTFGLVTEKDPGERDLTDFLSASLECTMPAVSLRLVMGDYAVGGAQGLVFSGLSGNSKGGDPTVVAGRRGYGIRMSTTSELSGYLRGIAATYAPSPFSVSVLYSIRRLDAVLDSSGVVTSFDRDGLHRTVSELERRNRVRETLAGGRIEFEAVKGLIMGLSGFHSVLDRNVLLSGPFGFQGKAGSALGVDVMYVDRNISAFSELACDHGRALAGVIGCTFITGRKFIAAVHLRSYGRQFKNPHGMSFSEGGETPEDESGAYIAFSYRASDRIEISAFYDQFTFPWRHAPSLLPSGGNEATLIADLKPFKGAKVELKVRRKIKPAAQVLQAGSGLTSTVEGVTRRQNIRLTFTSDCVKPFVWKSRVEMIAVQNLGKDEAETGLMMYQELSCTVAPSLAVTLRATAFGTGSYDSRLYEYEEDLPGSYLNPSLYGRGFRWFLIGRLGIGDWLSVSAKCAQTRWSGKREGVETDEDRRTGLSGIRVGLQIDLRF